MIGDLVFRLSLWLLLTANLSVGNLLIGLVISLLLPRSKTSGLRWKDWIQGLAQTLVAIPQAYAEAVELMVRPHDQETRVSEPVPPRRSEGLIFLDIFRITFTPKTIVINHHDGDRYDIHQLQRRQR